MLSGNIGFLSFNKGFFHSHHEVMSHILECLYCGFGNGTAEIDSDGVENGTPYIIADMISGSFHATTLGLNGQFENNTTASGQGNTITLIAENLTGLTGFGGNAGRFSRYIDRL